MTHKLTPNDPHPYHVWYKPKNDWIELPNTEANIEVLKEELMLNADVELDEYTLKYMYEPPTVQVSEDRL